VPHPDALMTIDRVRHWAISFRQTRMLARALVRVCPGDGLSAPKVLPSGDEHVEAMGVKSRIVRLIDSGARTCWENTVQPRNATGSASPRL